MDGVHHAEWKKLNSSYFELLVNQAGSYSFEPDSEVPSLVGLLRRLIIAHEPSFAVSELCQSTNSFPSTGEKP